MEPFLFFAKFLREYELRSFEGLKIFSKLNIDICLANNLS